MRCFGTDKRGAVFHAVRLPEHARGGAGLMNADLYSVRAPSVGHIVGHRDCRCCSVACSGKRSDAKLAYAGVSAERSSADLREHVLEQRSRRMSTVSSSRRGRPARATYLVVSRACAAGGAQATEQSSSVCATLGLNCAFGPDSATRFSGLAH